jgi:predicted amidohydrolase YtcJ
VQAAGTLIRNARSLDAGRIADFRIGDGRIVEIGAGLTALSTESVINAEGATLLPGLHDHHIHLAAFAASLHSLRCGPPDVTSADELASALLELDAQNESGWLRGIGYHPCVAGDIDRHWLDRYVATRPARIQHRGGRLWVLNSRALELLGNDAPPGMERIGGRATGRLYEGDQWLRTRLRNPFPDLAAASDRLAGFGVTGITDTTPTNGAAEWRYFHRAQLAGQLHQRVRMMGCLELSACANGDTLRVGEYKLHLLESQLPDVDELAENIAAAHSRKRGVAVHCVTLAELIVALHALGVAGARPGDRIEHAAIAPPEQLHAIRAMGLRVITQPHFIAERGDQYRTDVDAADRPWLYRGAGIIAAGIPLAGGSDAPFGSADPWRAMQAAVARATSAGVILGPHEALTPEQALALFLSPPDTPGVGRVGLTVGATADLCLLKRPWSMVREALCSDQVRCTWRAGKCIYSSG